MIKLNAIFKNRKNQNYLIPLAIYGIFIICAAIGMIIYPGSFYKLISNTQLSPIRYYYMDVEHYATMAVKPSCLAFYPLWPFIIRNLFHPQTIEQAAHYFIIVANIIFFITNFLIFRIFKTAFKKTILAFLIMLAFTVNPMAIFRVNGYTESIFSLFSAIFIWCCLPQNKLHQNIKIMILFIITFLMSLTRPILIQMIFSTTATLITIIGLELFKIKRYSWTDVLNQIQKYKAEITKTLTIWLAAISGYAVYGSFCLQTRGNFFAPFDDQKLWGKKLGFYPDLLLFPKSPLIDLIGLYLPIIITLIFLLLTYYQFSKQENIISVPKHKFWWNILYLYPPLLIIVYTYHWIKSRKEPNNLTQLKISSFTEKLANNYITWFCFYFAVAHSLVSFITFNKLLSLGRYSFATPFFFAGLGYLCCCIPGKRKYQTLLLMTGISAFMLVEQWIKYGQHKWLG
ncbi:MAG: mannosyltransferase [Nostocales cyanobacterium]|nr:MAG: mannosyltransferase [Nostocales cyanobacterium]